MNGDISFIADNQKYAIIMFDEWHDAKGAEIGQNSGFHRRLPTER